MAVIMSWSECSIEIAKTGAADAMGTPLNSVGTIKDKSTTHQYTEGDSLQAKRTGGKLVAQAKNEGVNELKTRVIEPTLTFLASLYGGTVSGNTLPVSSNVVDDNYSVKLTPKNTGATGIQARKCNVSVVEGYSEEEGRFADLTFTFLECADGELYTLFTKA